MLPLRVIKEINEVKIKDVIKDENNNYSKIDDSVPFERLLKNLITYIKPNDLSYDVMDTLNVLTIQNIDKQSQKTAAAGSFRWKAQKYPGDIDMLEFYHIATTDKADAINKIVKGLQGVAYDIQKKRDAVMADFKCGFDTRFDAFVRNMGRLRGSYVAMDMVEHFESEIFGYNKGACQTELNKLHELGAIDGSARDAVMQMLPEYMSGKSYSDIYRVIRKFHVLRWSLSELINGAKLVESKVAGKDGYIVRLADAVTHDTVCKVDIWTKVLGRWIEMTNIYIFTYDAPNGRRAPIGFYFKNSIDESTEIDIIYYSSKTHEKPFKLAKRIWNRAILNVSTAVDYSTLNLAKVDPTQMHILKTIFPLFSSDIVHIGQLAADVELLNMALEKKDSLNLTYNGILKDLVAQMEEISFKIFRIMLLDESSNKILKDEVDKIINYIQTTTGIDDYRYIYDKKWDEAFTTDKMQVLINMVENLHKSLIKVQDDFARDYLIKTKLHPRVANSIVHPHSSYNYLKLPALNIQAGGSKVNYYEKYMKYKAKYLHLLSKKF